MLRISPSLDISSLLIVDAEKVESDLELLLTERVCEEIRSYRSGAIRTAVFLDFRMLSRRNARVAKTRSFSPPTNLEKHTETVFANRGLARNPLPSQTKKLPTRCTYTPPVKKTVCLRTVRR
ncbi:hypothetical protein TGME49_250020 [Toxoplasma gondii ME49]|uniref:Uncharacterized protein n=3 Tax=Toxoplasma gondii TaxID=5811 RepID=B6KHL1_TOXGV|nr:hypothetical protein TGME49_250020 [Toxoplasma gondii ME49]EPT25158.1 hypothetical protein TGME49_250020 [Toxoplasma gondii ME49]ESS34456.1 hypothetical protein TGVEG_250020 [Toxoplasma gondii VEG]KYF50162.1 hypothetical protein TGARI_250020 [Toxoplasma gondii ARI]CEL78613.1 TPA: hypothetical protein BN1205_001820 [Toxoplasma gondii VEG]|eukprot:XP_002367334.1 hypothetical protein TGME49_250020 [Toxoplasma gondii ME49]